MEKKINRILNDNIEELKDDKNIISIFLIGSMASDNYKMKKFNDYDIRFIVDSMNPDSYNKIMNILVNMKKEIEKLGFCCEISDVIGPVKMTTDGEKNILLHAIVMTKREMDSLPNIHKYSYSSNYVLFYGKDLVSEYRNLVINPNDVVFATEGIEFCINLIKCGQNSWAKWVIDGKNMNLKREYTVASDDDMIELFNYSYKKAESNIKNMIITNSLNVKLENYFDFSLDELELIKKIETDSLLVSDINDRNKDILIGILYKLEKYCLKIYKDSKKYYNSLEWGIVDLDSRYMRKNGFERLRELKLPMGNNFSLTYKEYLNKIDSIQREISSSDYIVIFEPPSDSYKRFGLIDVRSVEEINNYIKEKQINMEKYNISFIEIIKKTPKSFAGTVMSDGKGNTIIEIINGTCDSRELTSRGANADSIEQYCYNSFDSYIIGAPSEINEIKEICQYFKGYYEFAFGSIKDRENVYFTFYSSNDNYINIFKGGKKNARTLRNR